MIFYSRDELCSSANTNVNINANVNVNANTNTNVILRGRTQFVPTIYIYILA